MTDRRSPVRARTRSSRDRVAELEGELAALSDQRRHELEVLQLVSLERDRLRFELSERNAVRDDSRLKDGRLVDDDVEAPPDVDGWLLKPGVERAKLRQEPTIVGSWLARLTASLLLRFARVAARERQYATAEVLYQAIILLAPRGFVWRQAGNMLAGQGLFMSAIDCFSRAIEIDNKDGAAWHAKAMAWRRLDRPEESREAMQQALALDASLRQRA